MNYITILETTQQNELVLLRNLFEQHKIDYKIFDENVNTNFLVGVRVQVAEKQEGEAREILRENGLIEEKSAQGRKTSIISTRTWFLLAVLVIIITTLLIMSGL
ncbi:putative signal transducing protein [Salinimicrobium flavum]|uniref:Signal transducing protein n=1 Tax=Salinimicrobium flavum TaxID=1737065 RepID=A0ABW5IW32_9FLAO